EAHTLAGRLEDERRYMAGSFRMVAVDQPPAIALERANNVRGPNTLDPRRVMRAWRQDEVLGPKDYPIGVEQVFLDRLPLEPRPIGPKSARSIVQVLQGRAGRS